MEDKRTVIAMLLCFLVVWVYTEYVIAPQMRPRTQAQVSQTPANNVAVSPTSAGMTEVKSGPLSSASAGAQVAVVPTEVPSREEIAKHGFVTVQSGAVTAEISLLGGRFSSYRLSAYKSHLGALEPLDLVLPGTDGRLPGGVYLGAQGDGWVKYTLSKTSIQPVDQSAAGNQAITIQRGTNQDLMLEFSGAFADGTTISKTIRFGSHPYLFTVDVETSSARAERVWFEWSQAIAAKEVASSINPHAFSLLTDGSKLEHFILKEESEGLKERGATQWVSIHDKYFLAALVPTVSGVNAVTGRKGDVYLVRAAGAEARGSFALYVGPKESSLLEAAGHNLYRNIDLGWFSPIAYPLLALIRFFHQLFGNYGLAIILLTLIIKLGFLPLTKASLQSARKMQDLQPEMKALRERIKDATELNRAILELYKKRGVNPMGGCLPILIQIPVFLGLYNALLNAIELRHAPFALWIKDLSAPEALSLLGVNIPVMLLLMAGSMYVQQITSPQPLDPQQAKVMKFMPIIFAVMFIIIPMPSGLVLYWLVNNIISIIQQAYLRGEKKASALSATVVASVTMFCIGYVLTLI